MDTTSPVDDELIDEVTATLAMVERTFGDRGAPPKMLSAFATITMCRTLRERLESRAAINKALGGTEP